MREGHENRVEFNEQMSNDLLRLLKDLSELSYLSKETLPPERVDSICAMLNGLEKLAAAIKDDVKAEILSMLGIRFHLLNTVGIANDAKSFENEAGHAMDMLQMALLGLDPTTAKNYGKALRLIQQARETD